MRLLKEDQPPDCVLENVTPCGRGWGRESVGVSFQRITTMRLVHMLERTELRLVEKSFDFVFTPPSVVRSGR